MLIAYREGMLNHSNMVTSSSTPMMLDARRLLVIRKDRGLPSSWDAWHAGGQHVNHRGVVLVNGTLRGALAYVTDDGWAGVVLDGETGAHEWQPCQVTVPRS